MSTLPDVYSICKDNSIRVLLNENLKRKLVNSLKNSKDNYKTISKRLRIDYTTLWDYQNRREAIPLLFFKKLKEIYGINLEKYFNYLESGSLRNRVKIIRKIDANIAKVLGAIVADGHLRKRKTIFKDNRESIHYELVLREEYKTNCLAFCKWFNKLFDFGLKPIKRENHYEIYVSNKVLFLILNEIFGIPSGRRTEIIRAPRKIRNSNLKIKKAFLTGVFMFDGGVDYRNCYVSLVSRSKNLILDVNHILDELNLSPDYCSLNPDKLGRFRILFRKKDKLKKFIWIFEKDTEKWFRLKEHFDGIDFKGNLNFNEFIKKLDKFYPRKRISCLTFSDFVILLNKTSLNKEDISIRLDRKNTVINEYLQKLYKWKIIEKNLNEYQTKKLLPNIRRKNYG